MSVSTNIAIPLNRSCFSQTSPTPFSLPTLSLTPPPAPIGFCEVKNVPSAESEITKIMKALHEKCVFNPIITPTTKLSYEELDQTRRQLAEIAAQTAEDLVARFGEDLFNNNKQTKTTTQLISFIQIRATEQINQINAAKLKKQSQAESSSHEPDEYHLYRLHIA